MNLKELEQLAARIGPSTSDPRPDWLRAACDEGMKVASYYLFLYELSRLVKPSKVLETGTRHGNSAAQFAAGNPQGTVHTIDILPTSKEEVARFPLKNIVALTGDSLSFVPQIRREVGEVDVLMIDSDHTYELAMGEYNAYRPLVRDGGIIIVDDIHIGAGLERMWKEVRDPKAEANHLHYMGFGFAVKDARIP